MFQEKQAMETPEHVLVEFEMAGPASRLLAGITDLLHIILLGILLFVASLLLLGFSGPNFFGDAAHATVTILIALVLLGYLPFFEWIMKGQTPGKRSIGIRVARRDGRPLDFRSILVRHAMRIVDAQPVGFSLVGLISMVSTKDCLRLGDMVAGTWVLRERTGTAEAPAGGLFGPLFRRRAKGKAVMPAPADLPEPGAAGTGGRLTPAELEIIGRFLRRVHELDAEPRFRLAREIARPIMDRLGHSGTDYEGFLRAEFRLGSSRSLL